MYIYIYIYIYTYIYIHIYICNIGSFAFGQGSSSRWGFQTMASIVWSSRREPPTEYTTSGERDRNLCTKILDFREFDWSRILILRGRLPMSTGIFPEMLSQRILAGILLVIII